MRGRGGCFPSPSATRCSARSSTGTRMAESPIVHDPWSRVRRFTPARVALGRAGGSLPTREVLDFAAAHADARDAVHAGLDARALAGELAKTGLPVLSVESAAADRAMYLQRPDLGRRLSDASR